MNLYEYLDCNVFVGLKNLNDGFDAGSIKYFSAEEFETVLRRVEGLEVEIVGLEPWSANGFYDVKCQADYEGELGDETLWYWRAFADFKQKKSTLLYSATFKWSDGGLYEKEEH